MGHLVFCTGGKKICPDLLTTNHPNTNVYSTYSSLQEENKGAKKQTAAAIFFWCAPLKLVATYI